MENGPCYKCEKRCVTHEYNCHSHCPEFKKIKDMEQQKAEIIKKKRAEEADVTDLRIRSMNRITRDTKKQNAWKG